MAAPMRIFCRFRFLRPAGCVKSLPTRCRYMSTASSDEEFTVTRLSGDDKGIVVFGFNRPKAMNAMSKALIHVVSENLESVSFDRSVRALIFRSHVPGAFCAGADLKERATMKENEVAPFVKKIQGLISSVAHVPMPTLAALDGVALGGGLELALACDIRTAATNAKMGLTETRLGIIPGGGGTQRLARLVGPAVAKELIFTANALEGREAYDLGVVNHLVEQSASGDAAYVKALDVARQILPQGPFAVRMAKEAINQGIEVDLSSGLKMEQMCYAQVIKTKDRMEGLMAFREKRKPNYIGE